MQLTMSCLDVTSKERSNPLDRTSVDVERMAYFGYIWKFLRKVFINHLLQGQRRKMSSGKFLYGTELRAVVRSTSRPNGTYNGRPLPSGNWYHTKVAWTSFYIQTWGECPSYFRLRSDVSAKSFYRVCLETIHLDNVDMGRNMNKDLSTSGDFLIVSLLLVIDFTIPHHELILT